MKKEKLKIGDIADTLKIKKSTIRQWEKELNINVTNKKSYGSNELELFSQVKKLVKDNNMSLSEVRDKLRLAENSSMKSAKGESVEQIKEKKEAKTDHNAPQKTGNNLTAALASTKETTGSKRVLEEDKLKEVLSQINSIRQEILNLKNSIN